MTVVSDGEAFAARGSIPILFWITAGKLPLFSEDCWSVMMLSLVFDVDIPVLPLTSTRTKAAMLMQSSTERTIIAILAEETFLFVLTHINTTSLFSYRILYYYMSFKSIAKSQIFKICLKLQSYKKMMIKWIKLTKKQK